MIHNNNFFIENLNTVVFLDKVMFFKITEINNSLKLNTLIVTSSHQSKLIDKKINYKTFDKLDDKFKNYINKNTRLKIQFLLYWC